MALKVGLIGLPNAGKSTTFNALAQADLAEVASYPFATIEPNHAVVPVPDARLDRLGEIAGRERVIHAVIEFVDIAGLVEGASRGEGLGNQFLEHIRGVQALLHVVRCFEDADVVEVGPAGDPIGAIEIVHLELALADLAQLQRRLEALSGEVKADQSLRPLQSTAESLAAHLDSGEPLRTFRPDHVAEYDRLNNELRLLTAKPMIYVANVAEAELAGSPCTSAIEARAASEKAGFVALCADLESGLTGMSPPEQAEMLTLAGIETRGLDRVIRLSYDLLGLRSFFTMNETEVRAWTVPAGARAPHAAGRVHTDFERGFIKAEVIHFDQFAEHGSLAAARSAGDLRIEGRDYEVQDGDLITFRFGV